MIYEEGILLYRAFKSCTEPMRLRRLEDRIDAYYAKLDKQAKHDFTHRLVQLGLITGPLAKAIEAFDCSLTKGSV